MRGTFTRQLKIWALIGSLLLAGTAIALFRFEDFFEAFDQPPWAWLIAMAAFALADSTVVRIQFRAEIAAFSFLEFPLFLGAIYLSPSMAWLSMTAGIAISVLLIQRLAFMKALFNIANLSFQGALALWLFHSIVGAADPVGPTGWLAAAVAGVVSSGWASLSLFLVLAILQGRDAITHAGQMMFMSALTGVTNVSLALLAASLIEYRPTALALLVFPTGALFGAYRAYSSERAQRDRVLAMHKVALEVRSIRDHAGVVPVLRQVAAHLGAHRASLVLFPQQSQGNAIRFSIAGDQSKTSEVVSAELAHVLDDVHSLDAPRLRESAESQGTEVAGAVRGAGRGLGLLVVSDRLRNATEFTDGDLVLFGTILEQLGQTFEKNELGQEITRLEHQGIEWQHKASHDVLTGLANRSLLAARLDEALALHQRPSMLYVDIDDFKHINDRYGHDVGDQVLVEFARRFTNAIDKQNCVARLGGDEFAVLVDEHEDDLAIANALLALAAQPITIPDGQVFAHASIGLARSNAGSNVSSLLKRADVAMYDAKANGKGTLRMASEDRPEMIVLGHSD